MLILTHELGHFIAAKKSGIRVNQFSVGMGPAIFKFQKGETLYALRLLPVGGFCAMEGEDGESEDDRAFNRKPVWKRIIVVVAGAATNILTGFILVVILTCMSGLVGTNVVASFDKQSTSNATGGLQVGDRIVSINGARVHVTSDIMYDLILDKNGIVDFGVQRGGKFLDLKDVHMPMEPDGNGGTVIRRDFFIRGVHTDFANVVHESFFETISMVRLVWMTLVSMFNGRFGLKDLAGPIGTTAAVGQAASMGLYYLVNVAALIAVNLGVVNLLPLPALDGGRLLFLIIEGIRRKPVNPKYEGYVHFVGFALLMLLMVVISYNDIIRLVKG